MDRSTLDRLPSSVRGILNDFKKLNCQGHLTLSASKQNSEPWNFDIRTTVDDGRIDHPMLPKPLSDIRGVFTMTPKGVQLEASQASLGAAILRFNGEIEGYQWPAKAEMNVSARGFL